MFIKSWLLSAHFLIFYATKLEVSVKYSCCTLQWQSQRKALAHLLQLQAKLWTICFQNRHNFYLKNNWQTTVSIKIWVSGRHFLEKQPNKPITSRATTNIYCQWENPRLKQKLDFWKTCTATMYFNLVNHFFPPTP